MIVQNHMVLKSWEVKHAVGEDSKNGGLVDLIEHLVSNSDKSFNKIIISVCTGDVD